MSNNYIEKIFGMNEIQFINTCDKFPDLKERELIFMIYNEIYNRIGLHHLHPGPNEHKQSGHDCHQAIATI